ncbi:hypothetical protein [Actinophytocola glycyrrhizae]|uniref:DUF308 domain-containing protein n=1 Tax=Actinophytocola glycyrrhizae TaxID=2044873 RepID=A0ABV9S9M4_9PSEU
MSDRPDDVDAAFAEIVADLEREGVGQAIPDLDEPSDEPDTPTAPTPAVTHPVEPAQAWRGHEADWDWSWGTDEEHYVPPEPPPLPKLRPLTIVALVLILIGVVLLIIPTLIGLNAQVATPIALLSITGGGLMLLMRARRTPKNPGPHDNGAQI